MRIARYILALAVLAALAVPAAGLARSTEDSKNLVETAVAAGQFSTLVSLVQKAGLADTLTSGTYTVFAPTDAAFAKVPKATLDKLAADPAALRRVLLHHVVQGDLPASAVASRTTITTLEGSGTADRITVKSAGGVVTVDGARVTTPDVKASNGTIHVIDAVLLPKPPTRNIVQTAVAAGSFKTLASLLKTAGLAGTLQGKGPFTVFAPTDAAFAKVPKATLASLAKNKAKLRSVLLYHVAKGSLTTETLSHMSAVKTLQGTSLRLGQAAETVRVGGARVTSADVAASNGVIHVIDKVLIPA